MKEVNSIFFDEHFYKLCTESFSREVYAFSLGLEPREKKVLDNMCAWWFLDTGTNEEDTAQFLQAFAVTPLGAAPLFERYVHNLKNDQTFKGAKYYMKEWTDDEIVVFSTMTSQARTTKLQDEFKVIADSRDEDREEKFCRLQAKVN